MTPTGVVGRQRAPLAAGSHLVVSHATTAARRDWQPVRLLYQQTK